VRLSLKTEMVPSPYLGLVRSGARHVVKPSCLGRAIKLRLWDLEFELESSWPSSAKRPPMFHRLGYNCRPTTPGPLLRRWAVAIHSNSPTPAAAPPFPNL
jgi:hypothetical protein